jgi:DNA-binding winged helix-turn-helix (wHTH) protein/TolB-like protein
MTTETYSFDGLLFDPATGELSGPTQARLPPKPARLLALLLERPGELVARDEVVRELWPDQHLDVDQALAYTVRQVRAALGDEAGEPRYVETLPKRGYRFVGTLDTRKMGGLAAAEDAPGPARPAADGLRNGPFVVAAILLLMAYFAWQWIGGQREARRGTPVRIALLPLEGPGGEDRLTEALLVALAEYPGLDVVGPATTGPLRGTARPHTEIGHELGVSFVASGVWRPDEETLFLQLVRVSDGGHVFAERFPGDEDGVYRRLPEAAAGIASAAREDAPALTGSAPPRSPSPRSSAGGAGPARASASAG